MSEHSKALCIIPARGGSKRIPRKNIRLFRGRPIISYVIECALASRCFDDVMVSTDDDEIATLARQNGASVPFLRSLENSNDHADTVSVLKEVLDAYTKRGRRFELGCCIYPTAVLTRPSSLIEGLQRLMGDDGLAYALPIIPFSYPVQRAVYLENGRIPMFHPENYLSRSQDLQKVYHDAGQWYWFRCKSVANGMPLLGPNSAGVVLSEMDAQDIDNEDDWQMAEIKHELQTP